VTRIAVIRVTFHVHPVGRGRGRRDGRVQLEPGEDVGAVDEPLDDDDIAQDRVHPAQSRQAAVAVVGGAQRATEGGVVGEDAAQGVEVAGHPAAEVGVGDVCGSRGLHGIHGPPARVRG
jgi:hypothetical protein